MGRFLLLGYGALWLMIKFSNMGKSWDFITVSIVAAAMLAAIAWFINYAASHRANPAIPIGVAVAGLAYYVAGKFFPEIEWQLDTGSHELDMTIGWGSAVIAIYWAIKLLRIVLTDQEPPEEQEAQEEEE